MHSNWRGANDAQFVKNMTLSLAFLAPQLVKAAVEGRLPPGIISSDCGIPTPMRTGSLGFPVRYSSLAQCSRADGAPLEPPGLIMELLDRTDIGVLLRKYGLLEDTTAAQSARRT